MFEKKLKLFYYSNVLNFGDMLNTVLAERLCTEHGKRIQYVSYKECNAMFLGSILQLLWTKKPTLRCLYEPVSIWGTGLISPETKPFLSRKLMIYALRGKLTESVLKYQSQKGGVKFVETVLGDPGLLSNLLCDCKNIRKEYSVGIIPHYVDKNSKELDLFRNIKEFNIIDVQNNPDYVVREIAKCDQIISSSLHGLIVADSLGIPNARMVLSNKITGGDFKYEDYYSVYKFGQRLTLDSKGLYFIVKNLEHLRRYYNVSMEEVLIIQDKLKKSLELYLTGL